LPRFRVGIRSRDATRDCKEVISPAADEETAPVEIPAAMAAPDFRKLRRLFKSASFRFMFLAPQLPGRVYASPCATGNE
jgi:hypothetical protein